MFEKIIEKIETVKEKHDYSCDVSDDFVIEGLNEAIEILKEEENKPFNPESFGFISNEIENIWEIRINKAIYFLSWCGGNSDKSYWEIRIKNTPSERIFFGSILYDFQAGIIFKALGIIE